MTEFLLGDFAPWFSVPAILGTTVFATKSALILFGGDADGEVGEGADGLDGDGTLKVLSITTIAAFCMGFGWLGLAAYRGTGLTEAVSMMIAVGGGLGMGYLMAWLLAALYRMQSSGNITMADSVGSEADVYLAVPPAREGRGEIQVQVDNRLRSYPAVTDDPDPIERHARVLIVAMNPDRTLTVAKL
ncbi:MAG: hypothetical protein AAF235_03180 [Planctomycetota bacterium]